MDDLEAGRDLQKIIVRPVYLRAVNAIVQPEQQVPCTQYFFREWLPRLGSLRWALVMALRHLCSNRQPDGVSRGEVSRSQLAAILGVHEVTISRILSTRRSDSQPGWRVLAPANDDDRETLFLSRFVPRLRYKYERDAATGTTRRIGYIIDVVMDDPLVPEDEQRLAVVLAEQILAGMEADTATPPPAELPSSPRVPRSCKTQNDLSHPEVNDQNASLHSLAPTQIATSLASVSHQDVPSAGVKAQPEPGLTLTGFYTYHEITVPLTLTSKPAIRKALAPLVEYACTRLQDEHSAGLYYATLTQLYPDRLDLFADALEQAAALGQANPKRNMGAAFVGFLRSAAMEAGVGLKLGARSIEPAEPVAQPVVYDAPADEASEEDEPELGGEAPRENVYIAGIGMSSLQVWQSTLDELRRHTTRATYEMWLRNCHIVSFEGAEVVIGAPNRFTRDRVREKLLPTIQECMSRVVGWSVAIRCEIAGE